MFVCSFLLLIILCYRISCCIVLQRHIEMFYAGTVKSHTFHGVDLDLCMKISFIGTFLQYVIVQIVASSWCAFVIWKLFYNCLKTSVPLNLGRTKNKDSALCLPWNLYDTSLLSVKVWSLCILFLPLIQNDTLRKPQLF